MKHCVIKVRERLDARWNAAFDGLDIAPNGDATAISGPVADQAALHGLLNKVRDLGLTLLSVEQRETEAKP
jgi:hypothetical protein